MLLNTSQALQDPQILLYNHYILARALADPTGPCGESLMRDKHLLLTVIRLFSHLILPLKGPGCRAGPVVAAQFGVMQEVPHKPDLRNTEPVNHHEFPVKTGVKRLKVGCCRRSGNPEGPKALVACWFDADQLEAHAQEDIINGEQLHLEVTTKPS